MNRLLVNIYGLIPKSLKKSIGQSNVFKGVRQRLLYEKDTFKTAKVLISRSYRSHNVNFNFVASIKDASKAKKVGIENTLLRNSVAITNKYFPSKTDLTVLDVGSNFGYLASVWADSVASNGKVFAFEPNKNLYNCIKKTINSNSKFGSNFKIFNLAVGAENGTITLNASAFSSNTNTMPSTIETYQVNMVKLDDFVIENNLKTINLIKIDVDGIELDILNGAKNILKQQQAILIVETNDDHRIVDFLKALDYNIYNMKLELIDDSSHLPLNIFCVPKILENNAV